VEIRTAFLLILLQHHQQLKHKESNMRLHFILFSIQIESYSKWSNLKCERDDKEYIIDFGYWRFFIY